MFFFLALWFSLWPAHSSISFHVLSYPPLPPLHYLNIHCHVPKSQRKIKLEYLRKYVPTTPLHGLKRNHSRHLKNRNNRNKENSRGNFLLMYTYMLSADEPTAWVYAFLVRFLEELTCIWINNPFMLNSCVSSSNSCTYSKKKTLVHCKR